MDDARSDVVAALAHHERGPADIVFEPFVGGRILERARLRGKQGAEDRVEHVWGEVTAWEPPYRLAYRWHLFFDPAEATDIEITFHQVGDETNVRLEQRGFDRLGPSGAERRRHTHTAWSHITSAYIDASSAGEEASAAGPQSPGPGPR